MKLPKKPKWILGFSILALCLMGYAVKKSIHSSLFTVRVVEIADQAVQAPLDAQAITELAAVPVGTANLFELNLKEIEKRLLTHPWIQSVRLEKIFPQTLSVQVTFRAAKALLQNHDGSLSYVDTAGIVFGSAELSAGTDLPLLLGFSGEASGRIKEGVHLISELDMGFHLASLSWDQDKGYRALIWYNLGSKTASKLTDARARTVVDLGLFPDDFADPFEDKVNRLTRVMDYLKGHSIAARRIWADAGKKIVVKTAHGS